MRSGRSTALAAIFFATTATVPALVPQAPHNTAPPHPRGYVAHHASPPPTIDGRLDDEAWRHAAWTDPFMDIEGALKPRPRFETRAKMLWDDQFLYIAADLRDPHLWATLTGHDSVIFHDNDFEVFIDPNGDNHEYYEFEINALGTYWDLLLSKPYKDDGKPVNSWEIPGLKSAVHLDGTLNDPRDVDRGWSVEIAFPWRVLGELARRPSPPTDGDQWRVNFSRVAWQLDPSSARYQKVKGTREDNWVWSPQHVIDMHRPETWGYVQFSTKPAGTVTFAPDPAWSAKVWLHGVYYVQREYRKTHGRFAGTLAALGPAGAHPPDLRDASLAVVGRSFEASVTSGDGGRWAIRQDSLIRSESR